MSAESPAHRGDIEGLRALAVIPVILCHAHLSFPGGFVGVDVFFVISGYLITRIILGPAQQGSFSLAAFYERRVRRIFPALFVVLAAATLVAFLTLLPEELIGFGNSLMASAAFVSNLYFRQQTGYFDPSSEQQPLLHIWSLAVEEQFYIFWPLLLLASGKIATEGRRTLLLAALLAASLVHAEYTLYIRPDAAFFLMPSRAWELLLGALLATGIVSGWTGRLPRRAADVASLAGIALICYAIAAYDSSTPFPGVAALVPCLGAVLVIAAGGAGPSLGGRLLSLPPLAFAGRISYSLYLWHWPILAFSRLYLKREPHLDEKLCLLSLTAGAAYLTWRFIEVPFRRPRLMARDSRAWVGGGLAAGLAAAGVGALIVLQDGFPARVPLGLPGMSDEIARVKAEGVALQRSPCLARRGALPPVEGCLLGQSSPGHSHEVVLWGDSQAAQFAPALVEIGRRTGFTARQVTKAGCPPLPGMHFFPVHEIRRECREFNDNVMQALSAGRPQTVVLAGWWAGYATGEVLVSPDAARPSPADARLNFIVAMQGTLRALTQAGHRVILVAQTPAPEGNPVKCVERARLTGRDASSCAAAGAARAEADARTNGLLQSAVAALPGVRIARPFERLCDARECRILSERGKFIYMDEAHLSAAGAELASESLEAGFVALQRAGSRL